MPKNRFAALILSALCTLQFSSAWAARSLVVTIFAHDELADISDQQLKKDYFQPWLDEMRSFTNHPIELVFQRSVPGITDINYRNMTSDDILDAFKEQVDAYTANNLFSFMNKNLLLTRHRYDDQSAVTFRAGLARQSRNTAISSMNSFATPGHEIGHMLSATHEDSRIRYNGWICETYMTPTRFDLRSNCYRYSDENRAKIADYLKYNSN
ncbi:hypothetical protein [Pseudomonas sp. Teo4]|uniref:hypothetical protein n=1 Tax=Pseudomonas sp. Teo4 TaxID=3064528 RepID=UPI002ABAA9C3|nr:hypothetical protein [Pseudomonas sp. Teo4]MDZ3994646.1 hypothetical protein [Pseudomonas sp. Teo4]